MGTIQEHRSGDWSPELDEREQRILLDLARETLRECVVDDGPERPLDAGRFPVTERLRKARATFVTFKQREALRGCMGTLVACEPLYRSVRTSAANAAQDPRFADRPIRADEVEAVDVHVSVLGPLQPTAAPEAFEPGKHGMVLTCRGRRAVFLPEVAAEQGWSRSETLSALCRKAGLAADAWKAGAEASLFQSVVYSEERSHAN